MQTANLIGKQIDQFTVEEFVAKGAMGMVFRAFDAVLARVVALKLIPKSAESDLSASETANREEARKRLIQEAKAAGKLTHPNIVTIHSYGETGEFQYICMEYISGKTLSQILRDRGHIPAEEAFPILEQILLALEAANRAGIVHRDIKPSNIMITDDKRVKVMDFGIAKLPAMSMTVTGMVLGTPYYMSPEQISGKKVDIRSDIFSLGAVFYEMLTGEKPFEGESTATLTYKIVQVEPVPPNVVNVHISGDAARVVAKALAKNPAERYQNPTEMLQDLRPLSGASRESSRTLAASPAAFEETVLAGDPGAAPEEPPAMQRTARASVPNDPAPATKEGKRSSAGKFGLALAAVLIVLGGALFWHLRGGTPQNASPPAPAPSAPVQETAAPAPPPAPDTPPAKPTVESLFLEAGKQFPGNPERAQKLLEEAVSLDPKNYECVLSLARLLSYRKNYPAAIQQYQSALLLDNASADAHSELGSLYLGQGEFDAAIQAFEDSLALMPPHRDEILANLGLCQLKKGNSAQARQFFEQSLELNPANATARSHMASLPSSPRKPPPAASAAISPPAPPPPPPNAAKTSRDKLAGNYIVEGSNPNGSKYKGAAVIKRSGIRYTMTWNIADQIITGSGTLSGKILTVHWKGPKSQSGVIVYGVTAKGILKGTWGEGKGSETLTPVN